MTLDQAIGPLVAITLIELNDRHGLGIQLTGAAVIASGRRSVRFEHIQTQPGMMPRIPERFAEYNLRAKSTAGK